MLFEEVLTYLDELRAKDAAPGSKRRSFPIESHTSHVASRWLLLLMLQESQGQPPDMKTLKIMGINYQPQLVQDFFHQQYYYFISFSIGKS